MSKLMDLLASSEKSGDLKFTANGFRQGKQTMRRAINMVKSTLHCQFEVDKEALIPSRTPEQHPPEVHEILVDDCRERAGTNWIHEQSEHYFRASECMFPTVHGFYDRTGKSGECLGGW